MVKVDKDRKYGVISMDYVLQNANDILYSTYSIRIHTARKINGEKYSVVL